MSDPTEAVPTPPPEPQATTTRTGFGRRFFRLVTAPLRFARRRPRRAALVCAGLVLLACAVTALGVWAWYEHHLAAARTALEKGHNATAARHLLKCQSIRPSGPEVLILSARTARRSGAWDEAEAFLNRYWEQYGDEEPLVLERLLVRAARGEIEAVGAAIQARIAGGGPTGALAREALVTGCINRFFWGEALRQLEDWLKQAPDSTIALVLRGKLEEQRLQFPAAVATYLRVVELDPEQDEARLRLSTLYLTDRKGEEAHQQLVELRKRLSDHPEVQVQWVRALALLGRNAESRAALAECLRLHPDFAPALAERAGNELLDGDEEAAVRDYAAAVAQDPGNAALRSQYALALAQNGKRAEAAREEAAIASLKADLERINTLTSGPLQANPNDPAIPHEIGDIAWRTGQPREALRWFNAALQADPNYAPTHRALAFVYRELDNPILSSRHRALAQKLGGPKGKP